MTAHLVIVGGSDAGISAGIRARELDPSLYVSLLYADNFPNFSVCGIPYYFSGDVPKWQMLAHRTDDEIRNLGISLHPNCQVESIDPTQQSVSYKDSTGNSYQLAYDKLIVATGAAAYIPSITGIDLPGVFQLRTMPDTFAIEQFLEARNPHRAVIVGGGYIGLEMAEALTARGITVTLIEKHPAVLATLDAELGELLVTELRNRGITVITGSSVTAIESESGSLVLSGTNGFHQAADLVLVSVGVTPNSQLLTSAGGKTGTRGAIQVNRRMETNLPNVYAAGDCVETWHHLLATNTYLPLGSTAHKQGRIAGENAAGGNAEFAGTLGTQVVKVFELVASRTGLRDEEAKQSGFDPLTVRFEAPDHKAYYPGSTPLHIHITGDRKTGRLLGAQIVGHKGGEVAKRIDIFATALFHGMTVAALNDLDLSYTPPLSSPWDPVQMSAQAWSKAARKESVEQNSMPMKSLS